MKSHATCVLGQSASACLEDIPIPGPWCTSFARGDTEDEEMRHGTIPRIRGRRREDGPMRPNGRGPCGYGRPIHPVGIGGTRQQGSLLRVRVRKVDRVSPSPPRLPRAGLRSRTRRVLGQSASACLGDIPIPGPFYTSLARGDTEDGEMRHGTIPRIRGRRREDGPMRPNG